MGEICRESDLRSHRMAIKVYLVFQRNNVVRGDNPNVAVISALLTRESAQKIVDKIPGTWIQKFIAVK